MKVLAIEIDKNIGSWEGYSNLLKQEVEHVYELQKKEILREIYFTENKEAVLVLECDNRDEARKVLNMLPLVKEGLIDFNIMELHTYNGFDRLI
jgi:hypothetical protein